MIQHPGRGMPYQTHIGGIHGPCSYNQHHIWTKENLNPLFLQLSQGLILGSSMPQLVKWHGVPGLYDAERASSVMKQTHPFSSCYHKMESSTAPGLLFSVRRRVGFREGPEGSGTLVATLALGRSRECVERQDLPYD